jgi:hypothetical protein
MSILQLEELEDSPSFALLAPAFLVERRLDLDIAFVC